MFYSARMQAFNINENFSPVPKKNNASAAIKNERALKLTEAGGPRGPEPTRYGDWEVGGRCTDF